MRNGRERTVPTGRPAAGPAHQRARAAGAFDEGHPAMATRVAEHPRPLVTPADGEKRHAESVTFDVIARVRDRSRRNKHARHRAQQLEFVGESTTVEIVLDGL